MFSSFLDASELESVFFLKFVSFSFIYSSNDHALEHVYTKLQSLLMCKIRRQMHAVLTAAIQLWIMRCVCPKLSYLTFGLNMLKVKFLEYVRELCIQVDSGL